MSLLALLATASAASVPVDQKLPTGGEPVVTLELFCGDVVATAADVTEVEIDGHVDDDFELELDQHGSSIHGTVEFKDLPKRVMSCDTKLELRVPKSTVLRVETVSGSVHATGIARVDVETVSGNIRASDTTHLEAETVSGTIHVTGASGDIEISTVSGSLTIEDAREVRRVDAETVNGRVSYTGTLPASAVVNLGAHNGSIEARLIGEVNAQVDLSTFNGRITTDLIEASSRGDLSFTVGNGSARLSAETFNGRVEVLKQ